MTAPIASPSPKVAPKILNARMAMRPQKPAARPKVHLKTGRSEVPLKMFVYGERGVGKSTLLSMSESPVVLSAEQGHEELGTARYEVSTWEEALAAIDSLIDDKHEFKTFGVDTLDWLEAMLHDYVMRTKGITDMAAKYGAGYKEALSEWRIFLSRIETLHRKRGMHIMLLAHMEVKQISNPLGGDFTKYQPKLRDKAYGLLAEWVSMILFAAHETYVLRADEDSPYKATSTGMRVLYTEQRGGFDAKNRYRMPAKIPLSWSDIVLHAKTVFAEQNNPAVLAERTDLLKQISVKIPLMPEDKAEAISAWIAAGEFTSADLRITLNKMNVIIEEAKQKAAEEAAQEAEAAAATESSGDLSPEEQSE